MNKHAFCRVETVADVADATILLLSGYDLSVEPVGGSLAGPVKPKAMTVSPEGHLVEDTPQGIAAAISYLLRTSDFILKFSDVSAHRQLALSEVFEGIVGLLNRRALQLLSACDIADLMEWIHLLSDRRLDLQLPYGHPSYPWLIRRDGTDTPENEAWRPMASDATRTVVCHTKPDRDDLDAILAVSAKTGRMIGIVNAAAGKAIQGFRGTSPDKSLLLPNHGSAASYKIDLSNDDGAARWAKIEAEARAQVHAADLLKLPAGLQSAWRDQHDLRRLFSLECDHGTKDDRNHAINGACREADKNNMPRTHAVTSNHLDDHQLAPLDALDVMAARRAYAGHNCGATIYFDTMQLASVTDWLMTFWDDFVGANFSSR